MDDGTRRRLHPGSDRVLDVGDIAPGFVLRRTFDEAIDLSRLLANGPVLLAFYVFDFGHV